MKRGLQVSLLVVGVIPLALGIMNAVLGAAAFVPTDAVSANLDSQLRFYGVWFTLPFFLALWMVRNIETCGPDPAHNVRHDGNRRCGAHCLHVAGGAAGPADDCRRRLSKSRSSLLSRGRPPSRGAAEPLHSNNVRRQS